MNVSETLIQSGRQREAAVWRARPGIWTRQSAPWWFYGGIFLLVELGALLTGHEGSIAVRFLLMMGLAVPLAGLYSWLVPVTITVDDCGITYRVGRRIDFAPWETVEFVKMKQFLGRDWDLLVGTPIPTVIPLGGLTYPERRAALNEAQIRLHRYHSRDGAGR